MTKSIEQVANDVEELANFLAKASELANNIDECISGPRMRKDDPQNILNTLKHGLEHEYNIAFKAYRHWQDEKVKLIKRLSSGDMTIAECARQAAGTENEKYYAQGQMSALGNIAYRLGCRLKWDSEAKEHVLMEGVCE